MSSSLSDAVVREIMKEEDARFMAAVNAGVQAIMKEGSREITKEEDVKLAAVVDAGLPDPRRKAAREVETKFWADVQTAWIRLTMYNKTGPIVPEDFEYVMKLTGFEAKTMYGLWWWKPECQLKLTNKQTVDGNFEYLLQVLPASARFVTEAEVRPCRVQSSSGVDILKPTWEDLFRVLDLFEIANVIQPPKREIRIGHASEDGAAPVT